MLRDKKKDVSKYNPFIELVNQEISTKKRCVLAKHPGIPVKDSYPYIIEDGSAWRIEDLKILKEIPLGTSFTINAVELHKGFLSGFTICYLFVSYLKMKNFRFVFLGEHNRIPQKNGLFLNRFGKKMNMLRNSFYQNFKPKF